MKGPGMSDIFNHSLDAFESSFYGMDHPPFTNEIVSESARQQRRMEFISNYIKEGTEILYDEVQIEGDRVILLARFPDEQCDEKQYLFLNKGHYIIHEGKLYAGKYECNSDLKWRTAEQMNARFR